RLVRGEGTDAPGRLLYVLHEFHEASAVASPVARQGERGGDARGGDLQRVAGAEVDLAAFLGGVEQSGDLLGDLLQQVEVGADVGVDEDADDRLPARAGHLDALDVEAARLGDGSDEGDKFCFAGECHATHPIAGRVSAVNRRLAPLL